MSADPDVAGTVFEEDNSGGVRNYAEALLNVLSKEEGGPESALAEIDELVDDVYRANPKFTAILTSPTIAGHEKDRILVDVFEGRALPTVVRFLRVLNQHGRLGLLPAVARAARALWDKRQNRVPVSVRSASPLDDSQQSALREKLAKLTGADPVIRLQVDPSLIGGLVVQVGDDIYDASVRTQLEQFRKRLVAGKLQDLRSRDLVQA